MARYWWLTFRRSHPAAQLIIALVTVLTLWFVSNGLYQVIRKPSELFFPVSGTLYRTPAKTWAAYEPIFREHSTAVMTPELLAAIAQVEGSGNPIVRTYWRWSWSTHPYRMYRPASSAVGMYQITDGTFEITRRYCVHDHVVVEDGPWNAWRTCWFNWLYSRVVPSHAVEMTSAYLDRAVAEILARHRIRSATLAQKHQLVAVIHLCGAGAGNDFARRGMRLGSGKRCGDHEARTYIARIEMMKKIFQRS
ncbi:MAG: lytic transglycosylase domain-containing protein [Steroidobacteraceae bacterium]